MSFFMKSKTLRKLTFPLQIRHLKHSMKDGTLAWYSEIDDTIILGAIPMRKKGPFPVDLADLGVGQIISLNEPYELYVTFTAEEWGKENIVYRNYNVKDHVGAATVGTAKEIISHIKSAKLDNKKTYVHCKAGKGRSASVVLCYLVDKLQLTPSEVLDIVKEKRPQVDLGNKQHRLVSNFYEKNKI